MRRYSVDRPDLDDQPPRMSGASSLSVLTRRVQSAIAGVDSRSTDMSGRSAQASAGRVALLAGWAILCMVWAARGGLYSWHYFDFAGRLLSTSGPTGGVHIFGTHPELQFGPVTVIVAAALVHLAGPVGPTAGATFMLGLGVANLVALARIAEQLRGAPVDRGRSIVVAALFAPMWSILAIHYGHLDDALALTFVTLGALAVARQKKWVSVILFALAAGAKPWAAPIGLLVLAPFDGNHRNGGLLPVTRSQAHAAVGYLVLVLVPWLPFLLGENRTTDLGSFKIQVSNASTLVLFGSAGAGTPFWVRPAQLALAAAAALWCIRRGRWTWVPLVVVASRMIIDPGTYGYYTTGLVVSAAIVDAGTLRGFEWTALTTGWWVIDSILQAGGHTTVAASLRLAVLAGLIIMAVAQPTGRRNREYSAGSLAQQGGPSSPQAWDYGHRQRVPRRCTEEERAHRPDIRVKLPSAERYDPTLELPLAPRGAKAPLPPVRSKTAASPKTVGN